MSEKPVAAHEIRALATSLDRMAKIIQRGSPDPVPLTAEGMAQAFVHGAAYAFEASATAFRMLSVVGTADEVDAIDLPEGAGFSLRVDPKVQPLEEDHGERARRLV